MTLPKAALLSAAALLSSMAGACSGDTEGEGGAVDDGKLHPAGNGVSADEATACAALADALSGAASDLACVTTFRACPGLVTGLSSESCASYDEGSVQGCADYYTAATDCDDLKARADGCVPEILAPAPSGCE